MATERPNTSIPPKPPKALHVLAVHENGDFLSALQQLLGEALLGEVVVHCCEGYALAAAQLEQLPPADADGRRALAVLGAAAPARAGGRPDYAQHAAAREFLARLKATRVDVVLLVLSSEEDDHVLVEQLRQLPGARLAIVSPVHDWERVLVEAAIEAAGITADAAQRQRTRTVIHIDVFDTSYGAWTLERRGEVYAKFGGPLSTDAEEMCFLCTDADTVEARSASSDWGDQVGRIGRRLSKQIFDRNPELQREFEEATREDLKRPQLRLVFSMDPGLHKLPVEALKRATGAAAAAAERVPTAAFAPGPSAEAEWHALNSPILRHCPVNTANSSTPPLFFDLQSRQEPVNLLLVAADSNAGVVSDEGLDLEFNELDQIEVEVDAIRAVLRKAQPGSVGTVKVLKLRKEADPVKALFEALNPGGQPFPWHIVHFAGHSMLMGARREKPALVLSPEIPQVCPFVDLARVLPGTRLLFLSSCQSANADFLSLALRERIPAILGYRWPVNDGHAAELAATFYRALFGGQESFRSLGRALLSARKSMFKAHPGAATWASPLLLTKGQDTAAPRDPLEYRSHHA